MRETGNYNKRVKKPLGLIKANIMGDGLIEAIAVLMNKEKVWSIMFNEGKNIFVESLPQYSERSVPLLEMHYGRENLDSKNTFSRLTINGRIVLPTHFRGRIADMRKVGAVLSRWMCMRTRPLFEEFPGLDRVGEPISLDYTKMLVQDGLRLPYIEFTFDVEFDLYRYALKNECIDFNNCLDAPLLDEIKSYNININIEKDNDPNKEHNITAASIKAKN